MELTVATADGADLGSTSDFTLDLSFGDSGNNFTLACPSLPITYGCVVAVEGTEWAGVVDSSEDSLEGGVSTTTWSGRTFHGVLVGKVLCPPSGQDYLTASGDANDCLCSLVARVGLSGFVEVADGKAGIDVRYTFDRYCDAYTGIRKMLAASGARLMIRREDGRTLMWAEAAESHGDGIDSDLLDFDATRVTRPVNHLVCAGTGELADRTVVHLYADAHGNVSQTQTLFGADEVCELYDYSSADHDKLVEDGTKKLQGYQSQGSVDVTVHDGLTLYVGDTVTAANHDTGRTVTATVNKKIVKVSGGVASVSYEVGDAQTGTTGGSGTGMESSSGGGVAYAAGEGIQIVGRTISADVTQAKLDAVSAAASKASESAQGVANDLAAEATRAKAAEKANADAIKAEAQARESADDGIRASIDTVAGNLAAETARATKAEGAATSDRAAIRAEFADADNAEATRAKDAEKANADAVANEAKARDAADAALSATAKGLRTDVDAATKALAGKPERNQTLARYVLELEQNSGKYWLRLGTLETSGDASCTTLHVMSGMSYNGLAADNSEFWIYVRDGNHGKIGTTVDLGANCEGVDVRVFAASGTLADIWVKLPWDWPMGVYTVAGLYRSWTPNTSHDNQADEPSPDGQVRQDVAVRTIASTDYVTAKLAGYQPRGDYAAKSHQHAASDVTSGVLPVARGGTGNGSGNAPTASRLASAHTITLKGAVTGSAKFDGSADVTITCEGQGAAASFLAAHPVGSVYVTNSTTNPAGAYGGTWARVPYMDGVAWRRTA